jgi:hypothetical protein
MRAVAGQAAAARGGVELTDIFRAHRESYRRNHPLPVSHLKVMQAWNAAAQRPWVVT